MAQTQIEFLYDFASPNCYVAYHKLKEMSPRVSFELHMIPLFLGGLFKITQDGPVPRGTNEYNYMVLNLEGLSNLIGVELNFPHSSFPPNSVRALRGSYFAESEGMLDEYVFRVFQEYWTRGADISDPQKLGQIAAHVGLGAKRFLEFIELDETKLRLRRETERAYERGVFGAPTFFVEGRMYWGTPEVLWFLEQQLAKQSGQSSRR
jgi:2-hydroxychromene-2-carboxylate isomerase